MPASAQPAPHAQTLRQARAAYKARNQAQLTEAQRKQLERSIELERRAWRVKEAEKRKAEAAKKRADKEKEEREEMRMARLGSQRRCDKFGYKSSQMHLGAFLGKPKAAVVAKQKDNTDGRPDEVAEEEFEYSPVDDETLLEVLDGVPKIPTEETLKINPSIPLTSQTLPFEVANRPLEILDEDLPFDEFSSSTQIARELDADPTNQRAPPTTNITIIPASTDVDDFDDFEMSADDLLELDLTTTNRKASQDRKLMPPPPLPALPVKRNTPPKLMDVGFTVRELECFIDDDLQLTQADPY